MTKGFARFLFLYLVIPFLLAATPRPIQYRQVNAKDGLTYNYVTALAMDKYQRLWVGTSNGLNLISNGMVRPFSQINQKNGTVSIGRVYGIEATGETVVAT